MNVFRALQHEWQQIAHRPAAGAALRRWAAVEEELAGFADAGQVVAAIQRRGDPERSCALLSCLLRQAADPLAARSVLQAILPGLAAGGGPGRRRPPPTAPLLWRDHADVDADLVACAWEEIRRRAGESHPQPARVLIGAAHRRLRTWREAQQRIAGRSVPLDVDVHVAVADLEWTRAPAERLAAVLVDAVREGRVGQDQARLVYATSVRGLPASDVGALEGLPSRAIYYALRKAEAAVVRACA